MPCRALQPRRHIAVVHFADLPPLHQAMQRTGDRPLGEAGGLAHLGWSEPLRPRGREGRQDLSLTTGWRGGRRWAPWPRLGGRKRGLGLERWRGGRRTLGGRGGVPQAWRAWRSFSHSIAAIRSASARENAAP